MSIIEKRKQIKKNRILQIIRDNENVSRYDVKKITKYSMTTVLSSVNALIEEGLVFEEESSEIKIGRTPQFLKINPNGRYFIGVEFNADILNVVVTNFDAELIYKNNYKIDRNQPVTQLINRVKAGIQKAIDLVPDKEKVVGIGLGIPGYVDKVNGLALEYSYLKGFNNLPIKDLIKEDFSYDVVMDNNINALTNEYKWVNKLKKDFIIVSMQYGTRLGIVLDNKIFTGTKGNAGEIGHTRVLNGTRKCSCGKVGCLDTEISHLAIEQKIMEQIQEGRFASVKGMLERANGKFSISMFSEALENNDADAKKMLKDISVTLGGKLATVISVLNIKNIIILDVCNLDNENFPRYVYETIKDYSLETLTKNMKVEAEIIDQYAGAKGAAIMVLDKHFGKVKE